MRLFALSIALVLVACGPAQKASQPEQAVTAPASLASSEIVTAGRFSATSNTAMGITGDVTIDPAQLAFDKGQILSTTILQAPDVTGIVGQTLYGESPPDDFSVELRRIDSAKTADAAAQPICGEGDHAATYVAISRDSERTISLVMFSGATPPTSAEQVCAIFLYAVS